MKLSYKIFLLSVVFCLSLFSSVRDILDSCDVIDRDILRVHAAVQETRDRIENISYGLGNGSNLTWRDIYGMSDALYQLDQADTSLISMSSEVGKIRAYANSLDNSSPSVSTNSVDLTEIITRLDFIHSVVSNLNNEVSNIKDLVMDYMGWFTENQDKITNYLDNWGNFTNALPSFSYYDFVTNHQANQSITISNPTQNNGGPHFISTIHGVLSPSTATLGSVSPYVSPVGSILRYNFGYLSDFFSMLHIDNQYFGSGIMNTLYTNTVDTISFHRDYQRYFKSYSDFTTNKITEINSIFYNNSPLEDLQSDVNPSNIYNFVTNYYIKVSTDPSGSSSENKTNWFNRIEMLLTALVFRPQETAPSNNFDNVSSSQSDSFQDSLKSVLEGDITEIQSQSNVVLSDFEKTKTSLLNFFGHLNTSFSSLSSLPSHLEFFEIDTADGSKSVTITIQGLFLSFVDTLRAITTLCWISFFIVLIFTLSRWLFIKFSTIFKFCYAVFKTLIGIG